jgi:hypothetical protein
VRVRVTFAKKHLQRNTSLSQDDGKQ